MPAAAPVRRVYYWLDDECGYAVTSADLGEKELFRGAVMAYAQLEK
jgi:anti-sigma factor RsiW